jgi:molybdopterin-guanine dinucleotide biosynthesis protein A
LRFAADTITGIVLAGGESSRMGRNKALLPLGGRPLIEIASTMMQEVFEHVCIIADDEVPYRFLNLPVLPDLMKKSGPLGGIHAGLAGCSPGAVFALACDTPFIPADLIRFLMNHHTGTPATVARQSTGIHPLCGIYERRALPIIEQFLAGGSFKLLDILDALDTSYVDITDDLPFYRADLFQNINDPHTFNHSTAHHRP